MLARLKSLFNPSDETRLHRIFWTGFLIRVLYVTLAHTYRIRVAEDHFQFGWEAGRIARALVTGYGYSDPFANAFLAHTGPTAWLPPCYPLLLAGIFRLFGVYTHTSAWVLFTLQFAFSAATALATYQIAARCFSRRVALWSAWIWALYPAAMQYAVRWPWETTISTALFSFMLALSLRMRGVGSEGTGNREQGTGIGGNREQRSPQPDRHPCFLFPVPCILALLRLPLGAYRALQLHAAHLPARLRPLDSVAKSDSTIQPGCPILAKQGWNSPSSGRPHSRRAGLPRPHRSLDPPQPARLPRLHPAARQLRRRALHGQRPRLQRPAGDVQPPLPGRAAAPRLRHPRRGPIRRAPGRRRPRLHRRPSRPLRRRCRPPRLLLLGRRPPSIRRGLVQRGRPHPELRLHLARRADGISARAAPSHSRRRTLRLRLPAAPHPLLHRHRACPLPPPARAAHRHPRRLPLPIRSSHAFTTTA